MDLLMFHRIKRYNDIKLKSKFEPKYKDDITLADLEQIYILDIQGLNYKEISDKLKINLNKIESILEMKNKINKLNK